MQLDELGKKYPKNRLLYYNDFFNDAGGKILAKSKALPDARDYFFSELNFHIVKQITRTKLGLIHENEKLLIKELK